MLGNADTGRRAYTLIGIASWSRRIARFRRSLSPLSPNGASEEIAHESNTPDRYIVTNRHGAKYIAK